MLNAASASQYRTAMLGLASWLISPPQCWDEVLSHNTSEEQPLCLGGRGRGGYLPEALKAKFIYVAPPVVDAGTEKGVFMHYPEPLSSWPMCTSPPP